MEANIMTNPEDGNRPSVSNKIRKMREDRRLTQADLARMSGLSLSSIKAYENGIRKPKSESMEKIITAVSRVPRIFETQLFGDHDLATIKKPLKTVEMSDESVVLLWKGVPIDERTASTIRTIIDVMVNPITKDKGVGSDGEH
jgi:transcriptional regulator with XRE-family HTH domain